MHVRTGEGFTLIELLVVIAIIGLLSAVVLASLTTARQRGQDAAIQADLSTVQTQAELYYSDHHYYISGSYALPGCPTTGSTMFAADSVIKKAIADAKKNGNTVACAGTGNAYAVEASLVAGIKVGATTYMAWCVDSEGTRKPIAAVTDGQNACP